MVANDVFPKSHGIRLDILEGTDVGREVQLLRNETDSAFAKLQAMVESFAIRRNGQLLTQGPVTVNFTGAAFSLSMPTPHQLDIFSAALPPGSGATVLPNEGVYQCVGSVQPLDLVAVVASDAVQRADANSVIFERTIGFCREKIDATTAIVRYSGELPGFVGLSPGVTYFLSTVAGGISPVAPTTAGSYVQKVGVARNSTTFVIMVDRDRIARS